MKVKIIGLGGTGSILADLVCRYLSYYPGLGAKWITLIDGDKVEKKNLQRQTLRMVGHFKVVDKFEQLKKEFPNINFTYVPVYVDEQNISDIIRNGDIVMMCVDNHKTRKIVDNYCQGLDDVVLISSGNEEVDGSCQIFIKKGGEKRTNPISEFHPEIQNASDLLPTETRSCEREVEERPQLLFTNATSAVIMCWLLRCHLEGEVLYEEVYFDINKMRVRPSKREIRRI